MSWDLLHRFLQSDVFNQNAFLSVAYLSRYADHVGIHYVLCQKLRQFSFEELEFFLPQLCHLIVSLKNESMALEEFLLDLCEESVNATLLTFWLFQTYLHDLSSNPQSEAFRTCMRIYNKVQNIVFGVTTPGRTDKIRENVLPVTVLASFVLAGPAVPFFPQWAGPLAVAQARRPQLDGAVISDAPQQPAQPLVRSHTVGAASPRPRRLKEPARTAIDPSPSPTRPGALDASRSKSTESLRRAHDARKPPHLEIHLPESRLSTSSLPLPDLRTPRSTPRPETPATAGVVPRNPKRHSHPLRLSSVSAMTRDAQVRLLRQNYFRCETQFLQALETISNRLVIVPKPARLSALRAELALIARDLPAEVDIPLICPATLVDGAPSKSKHHRIIRLNPAEATVLNSAEKVPFLLMVEILRDDFSFSPETADNQRLLKQLVAEHGNAARIFDLSDAPRTAVRSSLEDKGAADSVFEPSQGDLGTPGLMHEPHESPLFSPRMTAAASSGSLVSPRTSASRSESPGSLRMTPPASGRVVAEQPDVSALATHMRTASQMLAQLASTSGKRPRSEVAAIRAKIIASMQSLDEQSFDMDDGGQTPTFESIMAHTSAPESVTTEPDEMDPPLPATLNDTAGAARMENDQKTGGVRRKGDRDDPSAATFGETWSDKKERIRKSSPYGWMKNWDLVSVIVKTGSDLRQEAFACQLIQVCENIWQAAGVPVWTKRMRILVTGESSGLIETITNGVSLHSLKRSLTLAMVDSGQNPRGRIATLKDHFVKAFGAPDADSYKAAQDAFSRSLAAYSIISYVIQLKDRHNGNVLIDNQGHIIHIDFGFMLSNSPGSVGFEAAPFKLTHEYVEVLGGVGAPAFDAYKQLCKQAFQALRRSADNIIDLVAIMGRESKMPCFASGVQQVTNSLRQRFQLQLSAEEAENFVENDLIAKSLGSYYTRLYDTFQYRTQGIY